MPNIQRRNFLKKATLTTALAGTSFTLGCNKAQETTQVENQRKTTRKAQFDWRMVTTWSPHFPVLGEGVDMFAKWLEELSDGRIKVHVYGGGELVPPLEAFEAVSLGAVELAHGAPYYWAGKVPSCQFFASVPFGMNAQQMQTWILRGGGIELWKEAYEPFNLIPFLGGCTGMQMGGWFNKEINSVADLRGLIMRIPGLGGKVMSKAGSSTVTVAGAEVYTNLERGVIDATEWIGPYHDYLLGLHKVAKYYYYPGWHEPGTPLETIISTKAYNSLPNDLKGIFEAATHKLHNWIFAEFEVKNAIYLEKLLTEEKVVLKRFPKDVLDILRKYAFEIYDQLATTDPMSKKVYESYQNHRKQATRYSEVTERVFYEAIQ
jgi:TRAP-type mannitol/chloroaromatic compound transport system substrate-binding protein